METDTGINSKPPTNPKKFGCCVKVEEAENTCQKSKRGTRGHNVVNSGHQQTEQCSLVSKTSFRLRLFKTDKTVKYFQ